MTDKEKQEFIELLINKLKNVVIAELQKDRLIDEIAIDNDKMNILESVILLHMPISLIPEVFLGMSETDAFRDMYKILIKNTKIKL